MRCAHCGRELSEEARFCMFCGESVDGGVAQDEVAPNVGEASELPEAEPDVVEMGEREPEPTEPEALSTDEANGQLPEPNEPEKPTVAEPREPEPELEPEPEKVESDQRASELVTQEKPEESGKAGEAEPGEQTPEAKEPEEPEAAADSDDGQDQLSDGESEDAGPEASFSSDVTADLPLIEPAVLADWEPLTTDEAEVAAEDMPDTDDTTADTTEKAPLLRRILLPLALVGAVGVGVAYHMQGGPAASPVADASLQETVASSDGPAGEDAADASDKGAAADDGVPADDGADTKEGAAAEGADDDAAASADAVEDDAGDGGATDDGTDDTDAADGDVTDSDTTATEEVPTPSPETLELRAERARDFLSWYAGEYRRLESEWDVPTQQTVEEWADGCLTYVAPDSLLGQMLHKDPEALQELNGFKEAATCVREATVVEEHGNTLVMRADIDSTQWGWDYYTTYSWLYELDFDDENQIVTVRSRGHAEEAEQEE